MNNARTGSVIGCSQGPVNWFIGIFGFGLAGIAVPYGAVRDLPWAILRMIAPGTALLFVVCVCACVCMRVRVSNAHA